MKITTKKLLSLIGEQLARILELNACLDKADSVFSQKPSPKKEKRKKS